MKLGIELTGVKELANRFRNLPAEFEKTIDEASETWCNELLEDARERAPLETGYLRSTGEVVKASRMNWIVRFTAPYALYTHEKTYVARRAGGPKYLLRALQAKGGTFARYLAYRLKLSLRKGKVST